MGPLKNSNLFFPLQKFNMFRYTVCKGVCQNEWEQLQIMNLQDFISRVGQTRKLPKPTRSLRNFQFSSCISKFYAPQNSSFHFNTVFYTISSKFPAESILTFGSSILQTCRTSDFTSSTTTISVTLP